MSDNSFIIIRQDNINFNELLIKLIAVLCKNNFYDNFKSNPLFCFFKLSLSYTFFSCFNWNNCLFIQNPNS